MRIKLLDLKVSIELSHPSTHYWECPICVHENSCLPWCLENCWSGDRLVKDTYRKRRRCVEGGRQGGEGGCSQRGRRQNFGFFCPGWSYLRYWHRLNKLTPTSISMRGPDLHPVSLQTLKMLKSSKLTWKIIMKSSLISRELYISAADVRDLKLVWYVLRKIEPKFYQLAQLSWVLSYSETWNPICKRFTVIAGTMKWGDRSIY